MKSSKLVYSTDQGRIKDQPPAEVAPETDGIIRLRRETKGRKGKGVTIASGFGVTDTELKPIAKKLKQKLSVGGAVKAGEIEMQGDLRQQLKPLLEAMGYQVKLAGG